MVLHRAKSLFVCDRIRCLLICYILPYLPSDTFNLPKFVYIFSAGMEKTPMCRSAMDEGRIVFEYEPVVSNFVSPSLIFSFSKLSKFALVP